MNILFDAPNNYQLLDSDVPIEIQARSLAREAAENGSLPAQFPESPMYRIYNPREFAGMAFYCRLIKAPPAYHDLLEVHWPESLKFEGDASDIGNFKDEFFKQAKLTLKLRSMEMLKPTNGWSPYREVLNDLTKLINHRIKKAKLWQSKDKSDIVYLNTSGGKYLLGGFASNDEPYIEVKLKNPEAVRYLAIGDSVGIDRVKVVERSRETEEDWGEETEIIVELTIGTRTATLEWVVYGDKYPHLPFKKVSDQ